MDYLITRRRSRTKQLELVESSLSSHDSSPNKNQKNPQQGALKSIDKYLDLAREALLKNDRVLAESYYQYAEHYVRLNDN